MAAGLVLGAWFALLSVRDERREQGFRDRTTVVDARIEASWAGRSLVPVRYRDPSTGEPRRAIVSFGDDLPARDATDVRIRVGTGADPDVGPEPYGSRDRWWSLLQFAIPAVAGSAIWVVARRRRLRRARRLVTSSEPAYRMQAVPLSGRVFGRRWRLALHEIDARPGDGAVCVVPVVGQPVRLGARPVEVKGRPRPGGELVVRELGGRVWWPAGRAMVGARSTLAAPASIPAEVPSDRGRTPLGAWILLGVAAVALVVSVVTGDDTTAASKRSVTVTATVVDGRASGGPVTVSHEWEGEARTAQVVVGGPVSTGAPVVIRVDPEQPRRVWADGQAVPEETTPNWSIFLFVASVPLLVVAIGAIRPPLHPTAQRIRDSVGGASFDPDDPDGGRFSLVDGTLWFGRVADGGTIGGIGRLPGGRGRPAAPLLGFERRGLVVCAGEAVDVWSWDRHVGRDAGPGRWYAACDGARLQLVAPHDRVVLDAANGAAVVDLIEAIVRTPGVQDRLDDRGWLEELLAAVEEEGPRRGPAGPTILGDG